MWYFRCIRFKRRSCVSALFIKLETFCDEQLGSPNELLRTIRVGIFVLHCGRGGGANSDYVHPSNCGALSDGIWLPPCMPS